MNEPSPLSEEELLILAARIFGETTDFEEAYALAEQHAEAFHANIYDPSFLNQRHTTPLHIAVQEISDSEKNEIFLLFYDKNEPWVLLQPNNEGISALDILCRQGNEWLIRFLLPDTYNFDIGGLPDENIEDMDDDEITLYDILNLRFKHHVKHEDDNEQNNEFGLQYTLTQEPQSYPLAQCIGNKEATHIFKLLVAANFPLDFGHSEPTPLATQLPLLKAVRKVDARIKELAIEDDTSLLTNLLFHEDIETLIFLHTDCDLFKTLSRVSVSENTLKQLCGLWMPCIPRLLLSDAPQSIDFLYQFLAFIGTQTRGNTTQLYQTILSELMTRFETPQIESIIFILNAFAASTEIDWNEKWTKDKADELHDAYIWHIESTGDFNPQNFPEYHEDLYDSDADLIETYPHEVALLCKTRCAMRESCLALWEEDSLPLLQRVANINSRDIIRIFLAAGATFPEELIASRSFSTLCRLTVILADTELKYFISLIDTLEEKALDSLCKEMTDERLKEYVDELFNLTREFTRGDEVITLKDLAQQDTDYLLNIAITGRLRETFLPNLFNLVRNNKNAKEFFYCNYEEGIKYLEDSTETAAFHYFFSILLAIRPHYFLANLIKNQPAEILVALYKLIQKSPFPILNTQIAEMLRPEKRGYNLRLLCATASRAVKEGQLETHTTLFLEFIMNKPSCRIAHVLENDGSITRENDLNVIREFLALLQRRKALARARLTFWRTAQIFRQPGWEAVNTNVTVMAPDVLRIITQHVLHQENQGIPENLLSIPRRPPTL